MDEEREEEREEKVEEREEKVEEKVVVLVVVGVGEEDLFFLKSQNNEIYSVRVKLLRDVKRVMVRDGICVSYSFYVVFYPILASIPNFS